MASRTTMRRDILTIFFVVMTISGTIFGLPLAGTDGENNDGQMFPADMPAPPPGAFADPGVNNLPPQRLPEPRSGDAAPLLDDGLDVDTPAEVAGVDGTGLALMAGPVVPDGNTGNMFPDNMPPPPPGTLNDEAPQLVQEVPANNGNMFPDNMPPPPPGALNDEAPQLVQEVPTDNGNMFPDNMPPPPPGALNEEVLQLEKKVLTNNGNMFPNNMPPPPAGAINDEAVPFPVEGIEPPQDNAAPSNQKPVPQYQGMFPPNMPPPPPGAFNDPPPVSKLSEAKSSDPSLPSDDTAVEPVYVTGMEVPESAVLPPGGQTPFIDPNQISPVSSNQQLPTGEEPINVPQYNPDTVASSDQNTPETAGRSQDLTPNTQENLEGQVPYNPDDLDDSNSPMPNEDSQPAEPVPNPNETPVSFNLNVTDHSQNPAGQPQPVDIPANPEYIPENSAGQSYVNDTSMELSIHESYEEEQNNLGENSQALSSESIDSYVEQDQDEPSSEEWDESDSEYSFMDFLESVMESSEYDYGSEEDDDTTWESTEPKDYSDSDSSYLEYSSDYSELEWIFNDDDEPSLESGGESSEEEEDDDDDNDDDGDYFGRGETEEANHHDKEDTYSAFNGRLEMDDDLYRTGGTRLIMYCIPALILSVLILLAWKNYKGRIRVVTVPSVDPKRYDWKSGQKSEEHAPMLLDQDEREY